MSKRICIRPTIVQQLRDDFKSGKLNFGKLAMMSDSELRQYWKDTYGFSDELSSLLTSEIQKAVLSPKRAEALKRVLRKTILQRGNLYSGVSIENSQKLAEKFTIQQLADMSMEERTKVLTPYMLNESSEQKEKQKTAKDISKRIEYYKKQGTLEEAEKRLFGTKSIKEAKIIKGKLAEIERLGQMGLLTPENAKVFMRSYVETRLGVAVEPEEAKRLYELSKNYEEASEALGGTTAITGGDNKQEVNRQIKNLVNYSIAQKKLIDYTNFLKTGRTAQAFADELIQNKANNLLGSPKSLVNSLKYQITPSAMRFFTKRLTAGKFTTELVDNLSSVDNVKLDDKNEYDVELKHFIPNQVKAGFAVYDATGLDIARSTAGGDNPELFTFNVAESAPILFNKELEQARKKELKERRQQELEQSKNPKFTKLKQNTIDNVVNFTSLFPKWFAGTTDTGVSNWTKADTVLLHSDQVARKEAKQNKLPKGMTMQERRLQLVKDAYSLGVPKDEIARAIKYSAIQDAHYSNNTQNSEFAKWIIGVRGKIDEAGRKLTGNKVKRLGKLLVPFARISSTAIEERFKAAGAIPYGLMVAHKINQINNDETLSVQEKITKRRDVMTAYAGEATAFAVAACLFLAQGLKKKDEEDEVDYVSPYDIMDKDNKGKRYALSRAANATTGSIKIFDNWFSLSDFDMVGLPLMAMNEAYQAYRSGVDIKTQILKYALAHVYAISDAPVIKEVKDALSDTANAISIGSFEKLIDSLGLDGESIIRNSAITNLGAFLGRDALNAFWPPKSKYDFLGNEITPSRSDNKAAQLIYYYTSTRHAENMDIFTEFTRLTNAGQAPTMADPTSKSAKALQEVMKPDEYTEFLQTVKQEYARQVRDLISSEKYQKKSDAEKRKAIDKIRSKLMNDKGNEFEAKKREIERARK